MLQAHRLAVLALLGLAAVAGPTLAQNFPSRPVRIVIAFPPGGPTDLVGRLMADKMKDSLGQPVIIENKAGANGVIGADMVAKSEPDGHTIFLTTAGAVTITPGMRNNMPYDTLRDFAPITLVVRNTTVLVVGSERSPNSAGELAALAKEKPGQIPFASTGVGSMPHLAIELYQSAGRISFLHVPYRGAAPALNDLLGGQVQAFFADAPVLVPHIESGKIKALAVASGVRNPKLPNVPTLAEVGFPNTQADNWYGLLAPARTPAPVLARLHATAVAAINDPAVKEKLVQVGAIPAASSPQEFGQLLRSELERWGRLVHEKGIKEQ